MLVLKSPIPAFVFLLFYLSSPSVFEPCRNRWCPTVHGVRDHLINFCIAYVFLHISICANGFQSRYVHLLVRLSACSFYRTSNRSGANIEWWFPITLLRSFNFNLDTPPLIINTTILITIDSLIRFLPSHSSDFCPLGPFMWALLQKCMVRRSPWRMSSFI